MAATGEKPIAVDTCFREKRPRRADDSYPCQAAAAHAPTAGPSRLRFRLEGAARVQHRASPRAAAVRAAPETAPSSIAETARLSAPVPAPCRRLAGPPVVRSFSTTSRAARFARRRRSAAGGRSGRPRRPPRLRASPASARGLSDDAHRRQRASTASSAARTREGHRFAARCARPCWAALDGTAPAPLLGKVGGQDGACRRGGRPHIHSRSQLVTHVEARPIQPHGIGRLALDPGR